MKHHLILPLIAGLLCPAASWAQEPACAIRSPQDILTCALSRHPEVREAALAGERDRALEKIARQRPNPEVESEVLAGGGRDGRLLTTETSLFHTVEVGGKRRARIRQAQAQGLIAQSSLERAGEGAALQTAVAAHRLRQIREERRLAQDNRRTFDQIIGQYRTRRLLSPEQEVSLSVFEASAQELAFKQAALSQEEESLKNYLESATGLPFKAIERHLPGPKRKWPELRRGEGPVQTPSAARQAAGELALARANAKLAKSKAWPDVRLGPKVETERLARDTDVLVGGSVSLPLPVLSLNRGEQAYARLEERRAQARLESVRAKTARERSVQLARYRDAVRALTSLRSPDISHAAHEKIDDLFNRGLVPSSLMMEAHRQHLELAEMRHARELDAIEAYWQVLIIDGRVAEGRL